MGMEEGRREGGGRRGKGRESVGNVHHGQKTVILRVSALRRWMLGQVLLRHPTVIVRVSSP